MQITPIQGGYVSISLYRFGEIPDTVYQIRHFKKTFNDFQYAENLFEGFYENINAIEEEIWC